MGRVGCPSPECVKESREVGEEELRRAVTEDKIVRWKWLRRKRALEQGTSPKRILGLTADSLLSS